MNIEQQLEARLATAPVVPLIGANDTGIAVETANALNTGGLGVIEVVLRTDEAVDCMEAIAKQTSGLIVGAGTVLTVAQAEEVVARGAQFIVCPGLVDGVAEYCLKQDVPLYAGTMTAGEVQRAYALGLRTVKFFPASLAGGVPMLKALSSVFREMRFMPTGGVSAANLGEFLTLPSVVACGGSWLTPADEIAAGNYDAITKLAQEAVAIGQQARPTEN
ncbi:bifunctional 4-hydroxy-2-oxoglutarate aldolase/2-dehydro-3-deoxy-phosphogluconate aldolase [Sphingorhabdus sp.]|jgi:2-dehydro-3-deoxyphosphogluconate aldolase / (4S)-4-hydroxy-2-oxoglutarate aldolase|uniref:bifunctional 4-hydroxy-2-oxoglutarate aldolase/2-dehydro-3-deoxy-phosphogluconate aldolase n=1 Tax=Sphingorhabdus sp. TaxID=1902408 RepID=UPI004053EB5F